MIPEVRLTITSSSLCYNVIYLSNGNEYQNFMAETIVTVLHRDSLSVCVTFTIINDDIVEKDEMFLVNITIPFDRPDNLLANVIITDEDDSKFSLKSTFTC